jgi:chromate reductase, NAD(P)H dehydrogenase (quinone)
MLTKHKILALCGSTRKNSTNLNLIKAILDLTKEKFDFTIFEGLAEIPHFNPDLDNENPPQVVIDFRKQLREANGILICTPEYAMGVPGALKNSIDWTVSSMEFSKKPTALITASSMGEKGHASLLETLKVIEADITDETQLLISFAKTKVSQDCKITDQKTLDEVFALIDAFEKRLVSFT